MPFHLIRRREARRLAGVQRRAAQRDGMGWRRATVVSEGSQEWVDIDEIVGGGLETAGIAILEVVPEG